MSHTTIAQSTEHTDPNRSATASRAVRECLEPTSRGVRARLPAAFAIGAAAALLWLPDAAAQTRNPLSAQIDTVTDVITVDVMEFASIPDAADGAARPMRLVDAPGTGRMFVNDMRGPIYTVSYDGRTVRQYVDINDPRWGVAVQSRGRERGFQSFALHPQFAEVGARGYGKFYTWTDSENTEPAADFTTDGENVAHHTVLLEWTAADPFAATYDGGPPRELARFAQPFGNHNAGHIAFNPTAEPGDPDYGMLYVGVADGGSGGDPLNVAQNRASAFGKVLRIDPHGSNGTTGEYGIPPDNPFVGEAGTLGEIFALGVRNPQRFGWDPANGNMYLADIGQNIVEELSPVTPGANLGWNVWEGSFRYAGRQGVDASDPRSDPAMTFPVAEWVHGDSVLLGRSAATGVVVYRHDRITQLRNRVLFGDFPSGEIFHFDADDPPEGGNQGFGRVLLRHGGETATLLQLVRAKTVSQAKEPASRTDLRFGQGPDGRVFILNKHDGTIRELVPPGG